MPDATNTVDVLAKEYLAQEAIAEAANKELSNLRHLLIDEVLIRGSVPARALKTKALAGEEYELRVTEPIEVTVDTQTALRIKRVCLGSGTGRLFAKLFRRVETFVLVGGAQKLLNGKLPDRAPRNLRSLFARAVRIKDLSPQLEVRRLERKKEAA